MNTSQPFQIVYKGDQVQVVPRRIGKDMVYLVDFPSRRPPIMLSVAMRQGGGKFWTTIPEERERSRQDAVLAEAALLGNLITAHYQQQVK